MTIGVVVQLVLVVISVFTSVSLDERDGVWDVHEAQYTRWHRALVSARESTDTAATVSASSGVSGGVSGGTTTTTKIEEEFFFLFYKSDNVFTPSALQEMCILEQKICETSSCKAGKSFSPVQLFYPNSVYSSSSEPSCEKLPQNAVDAKVDWLLNGLRSQGPSYQFAPLLGKSFNATGVNTATQSAIFFDGDKLDRVLEEVKSHFDPVLEYSFRHSPWEGDDEDRHLSLGSVRVRFMYQDMWKDITSAVPQDMNFALGALVIVWIIIWIHCQSCWIASWGMFQIAMSLPISILIYKQIFRVDYFQFLHILILYVVLGVGADDIFVLVDSWRHVCTEIQMAAPGRLSQEKAHAVLKEAYGRASSAVLNTSLTTGIAFMACSVSKIMPMRTMGWYAAICISMNYVLMLSFTPSVLIIYHMRLEGKRFFCPSCSLRPLGKTADEGATSSTSLRVSGLSNSLQMEKLTCVDRLVVKGYLPLMQKKMGNVHVVSLGIVLISIAVVVQGAFFCGLLTPPSAAEEWLPAWHMVNGFQDFRSSSFTSAAHEDMLPINFFWGIDDLDLSSMDVYKPDEYESKVSYDSSLDLSSEEAQTAVLSLCKAMVEITCDLAACQNGGTGKLLYPSDKKAYTCFLEDFQEWLKTSKNITQTLTGTAFYEKLKEFRQDNPKIYSSEVMRARYKSNIGFIGDDLEFFAVSIRSSLPSSTPFTIGVPVRDLLADWVDKQRASMPASLKSLKFSSFKFRTYDNGEELLNGFFSGCLIAMPVCFFVLLFATLNVVTSLYAIIAVSSIVLCVLGFCRSAMGWDLGMGEAIAGVIVIGYSVDYTLHISHMYCEAAKHGHNTRSARTEFAICNMGSTVFAGAATTMAAGAIMFFCYVTFFTKMAVLITITIFYSVLYSLGFLIGLLFLAGPEGNCGDLRYFMGCAEANKTLPEASVKVVTSSETVARAPLDSNTEANIVVVGEHMRDEDV